VIKPTKQTEWLLCNDWTDDYIKNPGNYLVDCCPYGQVGDRLWVRESFEYIQGGSVIHDFGVRYKAGYEIKWWKDNEGRMNYPINEKPRPSIHLPRWASRITLEITEVRVERVQEITEEDAVAEGCSIMAGVTSGGSMGLASARYSFMKLWDSINAKRGYEWDKNPWVWVISFNKLTE